MKNLLVKVKDKTKVHELNDYCNIIYVSKFINVIGIEIKEENIPLLASNDNIISYKESGDGQFQPSLIIC